MKTSTVTAAAAVALTAGVLGLAAPALAAPTAGSAEDTISQLEAEGNRVIVTRQSNAPLDEATVVNLTTGPDIWKRVWDANFDDQHLTRTGSVIYLTVK
ncbi:hypothetical protein MJO55_22055 [Mycolicibacterium rufum]|uniref:MspA protein n=1 Tax=Mycolicibacterium rufum TaxID=318424 RepID=A0A9X2YG80_9MYCO|nr:hypothetical protein [Mycolicibacterium rufum]KGI69666.1 hypothetical protein EU78_21995 [Mycolicibacterium rufum]MCV7073188.1 hypothetical protein [Mycolicibacterium rufum]ULP35902.1 hypothetical protein MJO55_22055 [Mycolicibacterium rufum]